MKIVVAIPTIDRRDILARTVSHLAHQTKLPDAVVISTTDRRFVPDPWLNACGASGVRPHGLPFPVHCLFGRKGLPDQRNLVLDAVLNSSAPDRAGPLSLGLIGTDVIVFFDDDFIPAPNYLEEVARNFSAEPRWAVLTGHVPYDGARNEGYTFETGLCLLAQHVAPRLEDVEGVASVGAYGCNMAIRANVIGTLRFDERLPLYGWQEDIDFTSQMRTKGDVVRISSLVGVHLGAKAGRVPGVRFGYSQIANPYYLIRKGTMPATFGIGLILRNVAANIARSVSPEAYVDRRGRLRGNLVALGHALTGKLEPEYILKL